MYLCIYVCIYVCRYVGIYVDVCTTVCMYVCTVSKSLNPHMKINMQANSAFLNFVMSLRFSFSKHHYNRKSPKFSTTLPYDTLCENEAFWTCLNMFVDKFLLVFVNALRHASHSAEVSIVSKLHKSCHQTFDAGPKTLHFRIRYHNGKVVDHFGLFLLVFTE